MGTNDTTNWERRLKGERVPITSDSEPDYGFYRVRTRDKLSWRALFYWYANSGLLCCLIDGQPLDPQRAREIWPWASENAITHELYKAVVERGEPWPDHNPVVTRLSNNPPEEDSFESIQERIDDLAREAERLMKHGAAKTDDEADGAADVADSLARLWKLADAKRDQEKRPHWNKCVAIEEKWKPLLMAAAIHQTLKQIVCTPFLAAKKKAKLEAERKAREEAEAARRAAIAAEEDAKRKAAEADQNGDADALVEAARAEQRAQEATREAIAANQSAQARERETVTVGTRGRGVHLRVDKKYKVTDKDVAWNALKNQPDVWTEIEKIFEKWAKRRGAAGLATDGIEVIEDVKAA